MLYVIDNFIEDKKFLKELTDNKLTLFEEILNRTETDRLNYFKNKDSFSYWWSESIKPKNLQERLLQVLIGKLKTIIN